MMTMIGFVLLSMLAVISSLVLTMSRNLLHAVLALAVASLAIAGLMLTLSAEFIAFVVILVYVGAVVVIAVFAVMLTGHFENPHLPASNELKGLGSAVAAGLMILLVGVLLLQPPAAALQLQDVNIHQIGLLLMTKFVLPFELVSILLLAALIGAIVIARGKED